MAESRYSMFNDRRKATDRRLQSLSMPQPLDRRNIGGRRQRNFQSRPWWLSIDYCEELISSQKTQIHINEGKKLETTTDNNPTAAKT